MSLFDAINCVAKGDARNGRISGVMVGIVTNNQDPDGLGRVKVKFPCLSNTDESAWARMASPMAGNQRGIYFMPEVNDEVLLAFDQGDVQSPYVLGALWNGKDAPPGSNADGKNNIRSITSRSGHVLNFNDKDGKETIEIIDKSTKNSVVIDTSKNTITITSDQDIVLSASKGKITLRAQEVEIKSSAATKIQAGSTMDVKANETMTLQGETININ